MWSIAAQFLSWVFILCIGPVVDVLIFFNTAMCHNMSQLKYCIAVTIEDCQEPISSTQKHTACSNDKIKVHHAFKKMWFRFVYRDAVCSHDDPIVTIMFQGIFQWQQEINETEVKRKKENFLFYYFIFLHRPDIVPLYTQ